MRDIPLCRIEGGDIVLLECTVVQTENLSHTKTASFALNALYWLAEKPRTPRTTPTPTSSELRTTITL